MARKSTAHDALNVEESVSTLDGPATHDGPIPNDALITYCDVAARLGLALGTLYALVHDGRIPHVRLGKRLVRFSPSALDAWVKTRSVPAATPVLSTFER